MQQRDYLQGQQVLVLQEQGLELLAVDLASDTFMSFAFKDHTFATSLATASAIAQIISSAVASSFVANIAAIASSSASTSDTLHYFANPSHQDQGNRFNFTDTSFLPGKNFGVTYFAKRQ